MQSVRGAISNRPMAERVRDFTGLRFGNVTPTDVDAFMEFGDKQYVFIEAKSGGADMPRGQRLALERLCDAIAETGRLSLLILCADKGVGDIDFANCMVREYRYHGAWHTPKHPITVRAAIDKVLG